MCRKTYELLEQFNYHITVCGVIAERRQNLRTFEDLQHENEQLQLELEKQRQKRARIKTCPKQIILLWLEQHIRPSVSVEQFTDLYTVRSSDLTQLTNPMRNILMVLSDVFALWRGELLNGTPNISALPIIAFENKPRHVFVFTMNQRWEEASLQFFMQWGKQWQHRLVQAFSEWSTQDEQLLIQQNGDQGLNTDDLLSNILHLNFNNHPKNAHVMKEIMYDTVKTNIVIPY